MKEYFFIPGRLSELSLAELKSVLDLYSHHESDFIVNAKSDNYFLVRTDKPEEMVDEVFYRLGGFTRYGSLVEDLNKSVKELYSGDNMKTYGVSIFPYRKYSKELKEKQQNLQRDMKDLLIEQYGRVSYVEPQHGALTTGQILQRSILDEGFELCVLEYKDAYKFGKTLGIQDIEDFVMRDRERPDQDIDMGVLPPKLARMMVNLAGVRKGSTIWDPFCGSGTVLLEAMDLDYNVVGSDIDPEAVEITRDNVHWYANEKGLKEVKTSIFHADITEIEGSKLHSDLRNTEIDAIVCEPYMGPPQRSKISPSKADKLIDDVVDLYKPLFSLLERIKAENLMVVAVMPSYNTYKGWQGMRYNRFLSKSWEVQSITNRGDLLHWKRSSSIIMREILVARLKS